MLGAIDNWFTALIALVFFVAPTIKGVLEARKRALEAQKQRESSRRATDDAPEPVEGTEDASRRAWEELLRGAREAGETPGEPAPTVMRVRRRASDPPRAENEPYRPTFESPAPTGTTIDDERVLQREARRSVLTESKALTESEPLTNADRLTATRALTETPALTESAPLTETEALTETEPFEGKPLSDYVAEGRVGDLAIAPSMQHASDALPQRAAIVLPRGADELRRAFALNEVLLPPVSLRAHGAGGHAFEL